MVVVVVTYLLTYLLNSNGCVKQYKKRKRFCIGSMVHSMVVLFLVVIIMLFIIISKLLFMLCMQVSQCKPGVLPATSSTRLV